jgi:hypothetical protein
VVELEDLGGLVRGCAYSPGRVRGGLSRQPEIRQFEPSILMQDVVRFDIPMQDVPRLHESKPRQKVARYSPDH